MNVDGTTPTASAIPGPPGAAGRPTRENRVAIEKRSHDSRQGTVPVSKLDNRALSAQADSYKHIATETETKVTYGDPTHVDGRGLSGNFDTLQETVEQSYKAEIVDLATALDAKGLPLPAEPESRGVLKQDILRAYQDREVADAGAPKTSPSDILDTLG